jgi:MFS family permease
VSIDEAYEAAGMSGWYQVILSYAVTITMITCMMYAFTLPLLLQFPEVRGCHKPGGEDKCKDAEETCGKNVTYNYVDKKYNYLSEFDLVCDNYHATALQVAFGLGSLAGNFVFSALSDIFGRLIVISIGQASNIVCLLLTIIIGDYYACAVLCALLGFMLAGSGSPTFTYATDSVHKDSMMFYGTIVNLSFAVGEVLVALLILTGVNWRTVLGLLVLWSALFYPALIWLRESPRFLLSKNLPDKALNNLKQIARVNSRSLPSTLSISSQGILDKPATSCRDISRLLVARGILIRLSMCMFLYFTCAFVYYGISMNIQRFGGNPGVNALLAGVVEVVAVMLSGVMMKSCGNRFVFAISFSITASSMILQAVMPDNPALTTFCVSSGKFGISASFNVVYIIVGEIFPTAAKNSALGLCIISDRIGNIFGAIAGFSPMIFVTMSACLCAASVIVSIFMPYQPSKSDLPDSPTDKRNELPT